MIEKNDILLVAYMNKFYYQKTTIKVEYAEFSDSVRGQSPNTYVNMYIPPLGFRISVINKNHFNHWMVSNIMEII